MLSSCQIQGLLFEVRHRKFFLKVLEHTLLWLSFNLLQQLSSQKFDSLTSTVDTHFLIKAEKCRAEHKRSRSKSVRPNPLVAKRIR